MWSNNDLLWLKDNYPSLRQADKNILKGRLSFQMLFSGGKSYINPQIDDVAKLVDEKNYICDTYQIEIEWPEDSAIPWVKETSDRITAVAESIGVDIVDLHLFPDKKFCLASGQDYMRSLEKGLTLEIFFHEYLIPFLFAQSYFAKNNVWPWGQLSHYQWGIIEWLSRQKNYNNHDIIRTARYVINQAGIEEAKRIFSTRCRNHMPCPCNSGKKTKVCHPDIKEGITLIRGEISRNVFTLENLETKN